jgi:hypothetical protein
MYKPESVRLCWSDLNDGSTYVVPPVLDAAYAVGSRGGLSNFQLSKESSLYLAISP